LLLRVAQTTTTHTGPRDRFRGSSPACRHLPAGRWCRVPGLRQRQGPRHQQPLPRWPDPARLKQGIPYQAGGRHGPGQAAPAIWNKSS